MIAQEHSVDLTDTPRKGIQMEGEGKREVDDRHKEKHFLQSEERFVTLISLL